VLLQEETLLITPSSVHHEKHNTSPDQLGVTPSSACSGVASLPCMPPLRRLDLGRVCYVGFLWHDRVVSQFRPRNHWFDPHRPTWRC
jgi:hypothetical protein